MPTNAGNICRFTTEAEALAAFAGFIGKIESASHIKPLHWYVASRLVVEGGFDPDDVTPRPPVRVSKRSGGAAILHFDESLAKGGERTILGGLKTKNVDVVVTREGIGPALAVSCKGVTGAFRNLTNRMEETIGECTNLHITYPALVLGYLVLLRANRRIDGLLEQSADAEGDAHRQLAANDIAMAEGGEPVAAIMRFHNALRELVGRRGIRNDVSRYEAIALAMVEMERAAQGALLADYPETSSPLRLERFFETLYLRYDERFVTAAPDLASRTRRLTWAADSPALAEMNTGYEPRVAGALAR
jgi:hypothetical protein